MTSIPLHKIRRYSFCVRSIFWLLLLCCLSSEALSNEALSNKNKPNKAQITASQLNAPPALELLELRPQVDALENQQTQQQASDFPGILQQTTRRWLPHPEEHINLGFLDQPIWVKFALPTVSQPSTLLIEFANVKINAIELYVVTESNTQETKERLLSQMQLSEGTALDQRYLPVSHYVFPIEATPNTPLTIYAKVTNAYPMKVPIYVWNENTFAQKRTHRTMFNGVYFGSVLIMALYNLCLFFFVKDRSYANYVVFILMLAAFVALDKGIANEYLWPNSPEINQRFYTTIIALGALSSIRFTMSFLSLRRNAPRIQKGLESLSFCWIALVIASLLSANPVFLGLAFLLLLPGGTALFLTGIYMWKKGLPEASFYTIAWITLVHAVLGYSASFLGFIPYSPLLDDVVQATNIIEAALLSLGLAYRINTLNNEKQLAVTSVQAKSDLLATMSHEIRTPMNGILGMAQLLKDTKLSSQQSYYLKTILGSGQTLLTILNDILDHSKIEAGKLDVEKIPFNIRQTIDETAAIFATQAADKMLYFNIFIEPNTPITLDGDPTRIRQVLTNLLSNAFKFTDQGSVIVNVSLNEPETENSPTLLIEVEDQGIGIPKNKINLLFKSFSQTSTSTSRKYGGTGLGLSISKRLVELMGGEIGIRSEEGNGSTFWFTLPVKNGQYYKQTSNPALAQKLSSLRALSISDTPRFTAMMKEHAAIWNMESLHADSVDSLRQLLLSTSQKHFDFIFVEITSQLANFNAIISFIQHHDSLKHTQLIISAPAGTTLSQTELFEKPPWFIERPFSINRAFYLMSSSLISDTTKNTVADITLPFEGRSALVVDDNAINRQVALAFLKKLGINAVAVASGQEAFDYVNTEREPLDLILMDCEMPEINGFQTTKMIREWEQDNEKPRLPIIALSAHAMDSHQSACTEAGMDDFIPKPVVFDSLRKTLSNHL